MQKFLKSFLLAMCIFNGADCAEFTKLSPNTLIPRSVLFAAPDQYCPHLSPDGHFVSYIARAGNELELKVEKQ